ncbi:hypothetical protein LJC12_01035 [Odoribacter sp. OttesenSCG-928-J03]|nr:hypothetical protein [Odoribacter sp. OttesenSCG-928-J03]MDL2282913.1 hypothetical protein [Odoribacter sp. OttesenSCG-928-G04]MDL2330879.1 hypothetical protein [Odoribacter sp. OttesenSCG-928-A06]
MITLIINENSPEARRFIEFAKTLPFVRDESAVERIPGLPYTREERIATVHCAEEDYIAGRYKTSEEMKAKHPRL